MQLERAREIYFSPNTIEVLHAGNPVWITHLHTNNNNVEVKNITNDSIIEVPVWELSEGRALG
ncbi:small, acid-soluble spore protein, H family [Petroclostridium sp. X23]|jgi:H-type small acid-soluble spore protein|uniref:small, acid-soluble spore protein, H family n=1 Tax=Petroclostridium sp. X23 TaxID=3045146 RepID=UPI0024ACC952|nr:small, acid-soluble spore protein, H family [Petroclostridium sp. X23]WHH61488.1 small, acid-soluble spore protein, H family [Petroclostridium sp. X23]